MSNLVDVKRFLEPFLNTSVEFSDLKVYLRNHAHIAAKVTNYFISTSF